MQPKPTFQNLPAAKQKRITQVATEEFSARGFANASLNTMVQKLGIAKGSIFQYFGDKKGLFLFVFDQSMEKVKLNLRNVRNATRDEDLFSRIEKTLMAGVSFIHAHPLIYRLYLRALFESDLPFRNEILQAVRQYSLRFLRDLLREADLRGELRPGLNHDMVAFIMDAIMDRFLQAQTAKHLDADLGLYQCSIEKAREWVRQLIDVMRLGIEVHGKG